MPAFDGTGPQGKGAMTGCGFGPCNKGKAGIRRFSFGRGSWGVGYGFGFCRFLSSKDEDRKKILEEKIVFLEEGLKATKEALAKLYSEEKIK